MPEIVVHHLERSRSHRVLWLLEELELEYSIELYKRDENMRAPASLKKVHPLGKSPAVTIDGTAVAESGAILEELVDLTGKLRPEPGSDDHRRYRYFLHYAEASFMPPLLVKLITSNFDGPKVPFFIRPVAKAIAGKVDENYTSRELRNHLTFVNDELADRDYIAGDFSAADIQLSYPLQAAVSRGGGLSRYPHAADYLKRLEARPAYAKAIERGGPLALDH